MISFRLCVALILTLVPTLAYAGSTRIVGTNDKDPTDKFEMSIQLSTGDWQLRQSDTGAHVFKTKQGKYVFVTGTNTIFLCTETLKITLACHQAGQLTAVNPLSILAGGILSLRNGDKGTGRSEETGISFTWEVTEGP